MSGDPFKTDDAAKPDEMAVRRFAYAAQAALENRERIELPSAVIVRVAGGVRIVKRAKA